jgi:hypothetical protein
MQNVFSYVVRASLHEIKKNEHDVDWTDWTTFRVNFRHKALSDALRPICLPQCLETLLQCLLL